VLGFTLPHFIFPVRHFRWSCDPSRGDLQPDYLANPLPSLTPCPQAICRFSRVSEVCRARPPPCRILDLSLHLYSSGSRLLESCSPPGFLRSVNTTCQVLFALPRHPCSVVVSNPVPRRIQLGPDASHFTLTTLVQNQSLDTVLKDPCPTLCPPLHHHFF